MVEAVNSGDSLADEEDGPATVGRPRTGACPVAGRLPVGGHLLACCWAKGILSMDEAGEDDQLGAGDGEGYGSSGELKKETKQDGEEAMKREGRMKANLKGSCAKLGREQRSNQKESEAESWKTRTEIRRSKNSSREGEVGDDLHLFKASSFQIIPPELGVAMRAPAIGEGCFGNHPTRRVRKAQPIVRPW